MVLFELLMIIKTKESIVVIFSKRKEQKMCRRGRCSEVQILCFRERRCTFSLGFRSIGPSVLEGARSKVALRGEGYAWTPIWWSSDNSKRYVSFPTCVILWLRAM